MTEQNWKLTPPGTRENEVDVLRAEIERLTVHYNLLRDALSWFDAHNIDHLPQWVVSARRALGIKP